MQIYWRMNRRIVNAIYTFIINRHDPHLIRWTELARRLSITPPMINKYRFRDLTDYIPMEVFNAIREDVERIRRYIYTPRFSRVVLEEMLYNKLIEWWAKGIPCIDTNILEEVGISRGECRELSRFFSKILIDKAVMEVEEAFTIFRRIPGIERYIPDVSTNIVRLVEIGIKPEDNVVIGYPGRINVIDGSLRVFGRPRIGGSIHMAKILRRLHSLNHNIHGLTGIGFDEEVYRSIVDGGEYRFITLKPGSDEELLEGIDRDTDIVIDMGGYGRIGFIYMCGSNAIHAVERLRNVIFNQV